MKRTLLTVLRRCLVCDWEGRFEELADTDAIGTACESCHAPTERIEILSRRSALQSRDVHAAELGRRGGLRGGPARASALSPERRREIAIAAARARWSDR
jgi:hypothetical protein